MKTTRHATYNLNYHIVWLPKSRRTDGSADIAEQGSAQYRNSALGNEVEDRVRRILHEIADEKGLEIIDLTVQSDHVHLFVSSPPKHAPSLLANWFKGISSRKYNHRHADHAGEKIKWARGYYAGTAGHVSSETVQDYIQRHEEGNA
ncbi:IS200/IS605 family transposase [Halomontanus rarus]|uniref:IS200/IS605 family transposase n=1 Tax=Halomontanus rarus TaxID=3034020 RepID=UPI0023E84BA7|nr:IS200/IS605 family transposase [Halovivax sp. TS33]